MPKVTSYDGVTIAYDKKGQGPVLIQVLGALNKRGRGKKLTDLLTDKFTVISYDRRGRGESTDSLPYSVEKEVKDIEAIIDAKGGSAYLYGHSSGAILTLLAAQKLGDKVSKIALYELPYNDEPDALKSAGAYQKELSKLLAGGKNGEAVALFVKSVGVTDNQIAAMQKLPMWNGLTGMAHTLAYDTIELMRQFPKIDAASVKTPALIMYGTKSPNFMRKTAKELAKLMPNAKLQPVQDQDHDVKAEALAPTLCEFLAGH